MRAVHEGVLPIYLYYYLFNILVGLRHDGNNFSLKLIFVMWLWFVMVDTSKHICLLFILVALVYDDGHISLLFLLAVHFLNVF